MSDERDRTNGTEEQNFEHLLQNEEFQQASQTLAAAVEEGQRLEAEKPARTAEEIQEAGNTLAEAGVTQEAITDAQIDQPQLETLEFDEARNQEISQESLEAIQQLAGHGQGQIEQEVITEEQIENWWEQQTATAQETSQEQELQSEAPGQESDQEITAEEPSENWWENEPDYAAYLDEQEVDVDTFFEEYLQDNPASEQEKEKSKEQQQEQDREEPER